LNLKKKRELTRATRCPGQNPEPGSWIGPGIKFFAKKNLKIDCLDVKHSCSDFLVATGRENLDKVSNALRVIFCMMHNFLVTNFQFFFNYMHA